MESARADSSKSGILKTSIKSTTRSKSVCFAEQHSEIKGAKAKKTDKVKDIGNSKLKPKNSAKRKDRIGKEESESSEDSDKSDSDWSENNSDVSGADVSGADQDGTRAREDIYGRVLDSGRSANKEPSGVYVPPGKRNQPLAGDGSTKKQMELARLKKQLKGLLNRWVCQAELTAGITASG